RVSNATGAALELDLVPFARSLAGTVVSLQEPYAITNLDKSAAEGAVELQSFERGRQSLLAAPIAVAAGVQVVLELFDKTAAAGSGRVAFNAADQRLLAAAPDFRAQILPPALSDPPIHHVPF